jgi:hypothetical protein
VDRGERELDLLLGDEEHTLAPVPSGE